MGPGWLHILSIAFLALGVFCALVIAAHETRDPQHMWIMNIVWPVVALFGTVLVVWQYFVYGRLASRARKADARLRRAIRSSGF